MSGGDLDGVLSPWLRRQRLDAARVHVSGSVLDFGCGVADLCAFAEQAQYVGVDLDASILEVARNRYPHASFYTPDQFAALPARHFDTVAALAVIEHLPDPVAFLSDMKQRLTEPGRIVLTTPNPMLEWAHGLGARFGIFARESHEEHQSLMNRSALHAAASAAGLKVVLYKRFLFGANQVAVFGNRLLTLLIVGGILPV